jgi:PilZ domain
MLKQSKQSASPSRRFTSRIETLDRVWVDWRCAGGEDVSRVRNMSLGGLFIETPTSRGVGSPVNLEFLVQEGQIRADAVVKRVEPSRGLAMKFTLVNEEDRDRLAALMNRLRDDFRSAQRQT